MDNYAYAVARIRALEINLITNADIDRLMSCSDIESSLRLLSEKGWDTENYELMFSNEREKTWATVSELIDNSLLSIFSFEKDFHNLKAAIKSLVTNDVPDGIFYTDASFDKDTLLNIVKEKDFEKLPKYMQAPAREAYETLMHTGNGQLCDMILDKATLLAIKESAENSKEDILKDYAKSYIETANIKIAVRSAKTGKSEDFISNALAPFGSVNINDLSRAAAQGEEQLSAYLSENGFSKATQMLEKSVNAFECWCDNNIIDAIRPQKYNPFSAGPVIAYYLARENEIKTVKIILTCKQNGFSDESIRERIRKMYE